MNWRANVKNLVVKPYWVLGYTTQDFPGDNSSLNTIQQHGSLIDAYADFAYRIFPNATFTGQINTQILQEATYLNIAPLILFHNFYASRFDPHPLIVMLSSPFLQQLCINNILKVLPANAAGIYLDFEAIPAHLSIPYINFLESLSVRLHAEGLLLAIAVPAKIDHWQGPGYDFQRIGNLCDSVTVMTYDEHFAGGPPGPIASIPWMTQCLNYATRLIPREKILIGIPVYGYDWSYGQAKMIPMKEISALVAKTKANVLWSDSAAEPYFFYWQQGVKHTVWFENDTSIKIRLGLVKKYNVRGIAIWRLGYESKGFWQSVGAEL
ncbi:MAG: glycosyl hydrolase family 18 protein [Peptococcaceae bacterium]|nr:glycosyl hydrolase family 18 protein [Peptococcaceae bacterium]